MAKRSTFKGKVTRRKPVKRKLSLRVQPGKMVQLKSHIFAIERYTETPAISKVIDAWPMLPDKVKAEVLEKSPTFARLVAIAERITR